MRSFQLWEHTVLFVLIGKLSHRELRCILLFPSLLPPSSRAPGGGVGVGVENRSGWRKSQASRMSLQHGGPARTHSPPSTRLQKGASQNQPWASDLNAGQGPGTRAIPKSILNSAAWREDRGGKTWPGAEARTQGSGWKGRGFPDRKARNWLSLGVRAQRGLGTQAVSVTRAR